MKALVTGAGGFVGSHLVRYLLSQPDTTVIAALRREIEAYPHLPAVESVQVELTETERVEAIVAEIQPDQIYHLAGQAFVPKSFEDPWDTLENNIRSQLNLFEAIKKAAIDCRVLVLGSGEEYGPVSPDENPVSEDHPFRPTSPYAVSKISQDLLGQQYHRASGMDVVIARPFNHIGPGQNVRFVAPAFCSQIAQIEQSKQVPVMKVGNLEAQRDFTDVRDIVRAYSMLMAKGEAGEAYNVGSGNAHSIQHLLDILLDYAQVDIEVVVDPDRLRPVEVPLMVCDAGKLREATGWTPAIAFEQSLHDVLHEWRQYYATGE